METSQKRDIRLYAAVCIVVGIVTLLIDAMSSLAGLSSRSSTFSQPPGSGYPKSRMPLSNPHKTYRSSTGVSPVSQLSSLSYMKN